MQNVIVVSGCTHKEGFVDEYADQLAAADIPFHLETIDAMPGGANDFTIQRRLQFFRSMAEKFSNYTTIIATDAWDMLFFGTKQDLLDYSPNSIMWAAERDCYPEKHDIHGSTPWRYVNAGVTAFSPEFVLTWCENVEKYGELDLLDQAWLNRRLAEGSWMVSIDYLTRLFYVVSQSREDDSLRIKNGRLWNSHTGSFPSFFHFSGHCPTDNIRRLLHG